MWFDVGKVFRIGTVRYNWPMSAHASQAFSTAHCTEALVHFRTLVTLRRVRVRVRVGLELRLGLVRVRIRVRIRLGLDLGLGLS